MDNLSSLERSEIMGRVRSTNTRPEMLVRKIVYGMGYHYRLHVKHLPGKPDIVFVKSKKVIFIHGCFWHRHQDEKCKLARLPKSRVEFWTSKLDRNRLRDISNIEHLIKQGWNVMTIWECQLKAIDRLKFEIESFLKDEID